MTAIFSATVAKSEPRLLHERNGERGGRPIGATVLAPPGGENLRFPEVFSHITSGHNTDQLKGP